MGRRGGGGGVCKNFHKKRKLNRKPVESPWNPQRRRGGGVANFTKNCILKPSEKITLRKSLI